MTINKEQQINAATERLEQREPNCSNDSLHSEGRYKQKHSLMNTTFNDFMSANHFVNVRSHPPIYENSQEVYP